MILDVSFSNEVAIHLRLCATNLLRNINEFCFFDIYNGRLWENVSCVYDL